MIQLAGKFISNEEFFSLRLAFHKVPVFDLRTQNSPTCNDLATILHDDNMGAERYIILHQKNLGLQRINDTEPEYDPLHFLLLFPHGELGWHSAFRYPSDATSHNNNRVSCGESAAYSLCIRAIGYSLPHCAARSFASRVSTLTTEMGVPNLSGSSDTSRLIT